MSGSRYGGTWRGGATPSIAGAAGGRRSSAGCAHPYRAIAPAALMILLAMAPCAARAGEQASPGALSPLPAAATPPDSRRPAGPVVPLRLDEAVALGLRDNRIIRSAYLDRIAQRFSLVVARATFVPRITLAGDVTAIRSGGTTQRVVTTGPAVAWRAPTGADVGFVWTRTQRLNGGEAANLYALTLTQPLLRGGGIAVNRAPIRIAEIQERINKLSLRGTVINTVSGIVFAYRALVQAQEQVRLAEAAVARTGQLLTTNRALIAAGRLAAADIVQAEANLANQEVLLIQSRQARTSTQLALLQQLAADPRTNIVASDPASAARVMVATDIAVASALASRPDSLAQLGALEQSRQALLVARNNRLWDLSVDAAASRFDATDPIGGRLPSQSDRSVALRLAIPLYEPALRQQVIQAETGLRTAEVRYEELRQNVETQVRDSVQTVDAAWFQVETAQRARSLAARALEVERAKLAVGRTSNFEVLSFQDALLSAEVQELSATIGYQNALTALDQQIGSTLETWRIALND